MTGGGAGDPLLANMSLHINICIYKLVRTKGDSLAYLILVLYVSVCVHLWLTALRPNDMEQNAS